MSSFFRRTGPRNTLLLIAAALAFEAFPLRAEETFRVMSFNILRPKWGRETDPPWELRKRAVTAVLREIKPDLLGLQEETQEQLADLLVLNPGFKPVGTRPDMGGSIVFSEAKFEPKKTGDLQAPGRRLIQWALLRHRNSNVRVLMYNVHLVPKEKDDALRLEGMKILLDHLVSFPSPYDLVLLTGDFNSRESEAPMKFFFEFQMPHFQSAWRMHHGFSDQAKTAQLVSEAKAAAKKLEESEATGTQLSAEAVSKLNAILTASGQGTFHGYLPRTRPGPLDYIMIPDTVRVVDAQVLTGKYEGVFPSDHFPVWAEIVLPDSRASN